MATGRWSASRRPMRDPMPGSSSRDKAIASAPASAGRLLHLDDTLGGHAQLAQQVILEIRAVGLTLYGLGHATQPGITLGLTDVPAGMEHGNADGAVALLKQLGPAKPSTQKAGKLVPRHGQIFGVHSPYGPGGFPAVHDVVEVVHQSANTFDASSNLIGSVLRAVDRPCIGGHMQILMRGGKVMDDIEIGRASCRERV